MARMGESKGEYRILLANPEGKRPPGITRHRWEDNISMGLQEVGSGKWGYELDRAGSGWGQLAGTCDYGNELSGSIKCGEFLD